MLCLITPSKANINIRKLNMEVKLHVGMLLNRATFKEYVKIIALNWFYMEILTRVLFAGGLQVY